MGYKVNSKDKCNKSIILVIFDIDNQGPIVLYELLNKHGYRCKLVYFLHDGADNREALKDFIHTQNAVFVGFSFASHSTELAFSLSKQLAQSFPKIPIIFGGVHPSIDTDSCIDKCNAVCIGEGEVAILEVAEKILNNNNYLTSRNLVYKTEEGKVVRNEINPLITDLDTLPIRRIVSDGHVIVEDGKVNIVDKKKYFEINPRARTNYIQTFSRGCPSACSYCCNSKYRSIYTKWSKVRSKSVEATIKEIYEIVEFNSDLEKVFIIDDCFFVHDVKWLNNFVGQWRQKINKELTCFAIPHFVTEEKIKVLKSLDLCHISVGLQSGSEKTNASYNRKFSSDKFLQTCELINSFHVGLVVNVIFDNPWEDNEDLYKTLDVLTRIKKPFYIIHYSLKLYPGTKLYEKLSEDVQNIPDFNLWYTDYFTIGSSDTNRILILSQFLTRTFSLWLFDNKQRVLCKYLIRVLHVLAGLVMPFHALRIAGSRSFLKNVKIAISHRKQAIRLVKGILGLKK